MTLANRAIFWAPRTLSMLFIVFVSMFALDVFGERLGFWQTIGALVIHLIPTWIMLVALVAAWRREWIGAATFSLFAIVFLGIVRGPLSVKMCFALPCLVTAGLFLLDWRQRRARQTVTLWRLPAPKPAGRSGIEKER